MSDPAEIHRQSKRDMLAFTQKHLPALCAELAQFQDTGLLGQGKMRELADLCTFDTHGHLRQAERMIEHAAIRAVIEAPATTVDTSAWPAKLKLRNTGIHDEKTGATIFTTAGFGYEKVEYVRADLLGEVHVIQPHGQGVSHRIELGPDK